MIAVAVAVIIGVVAVTCGIVADSNHADTLTFLGLMVKTTAAQIFPSGAICTWALFASLWLLSVGIRRSKERGLELRLLKAIRTPALFGAAAPTPSPPATDLPDLAGLAPTAHARTATGMADQAMSAPTPADETNWPDATYAAHVTTSADPTDSTDPTDSEPTIDFDDLTSSTTFSHLHNLNDSSASAHAYDLSNSTTFGRLHDFSDLGHIDDLNGLSTVDHTRSIAELGLGRHVESGRFYRTNPRPNSAD